ASEVRNFLGVCGSPARRGKSARCQPHVRHPNAAPERRARFPCGRWNVVSPAAYLDGHLKHQTAPQPTYLFTPAPAPAAAAGTGSGGRTTAGLGVGAEAVAGFGSGRLMSILPLNRAPSSMLIRDVVM